MCTLRRSATPHPYGERFHQEKSSNKKNNDDVLSAYTTVGGERAGDGCDEEKHTECMATTEVGTPVVWCGEPFWGRQRVAGCHFRDEENNDDSGDNPRAWRGNENCGEERDSYSGEEKRVSR